MGLCRQRTCRLASSGKLHLHGLTAGSSEAQYSSGHPGNRKNTLMKSINLLPILDLTAAMNFIRRPNEVILARCTDGTVLIDCRPDPASIVGCVSKPAVRTMLAKGWIVPGDQVFDITHRGQMAASCHFFGPAANYQLSQTSRNERGKASRLQAAVQNDTKEEHPARHPKKSKVQLADMTDRGHNPPTGEPRSGDRESKAASSATDDRALADAFVKGCRRFNHLYPNGIPFETMSLEERELTRRHWDRIFCYFKDEQNQSDDTAAQGAETIAGAAWLQRINQPGRSSGAEASSAGPPTAGFEFGPDATVSDGADLDAVPTVTLNPHPTPARRSRSRTKSRKGLQT
jgi:hypothetical protein